MSTDESWFEVQTLQAEQNALVADLVERGEMLYLHDIPVLLDAFERVAKVRAQQGKRMSRRTLEALELLGEQMKEQRRLLKEMQR